MTESRKIMWKTLLGILTLALIGATAGRFLQLSPSVTISAPAVDVPVSKVDKVVSLLEQAPFFPGETIVYEIRKFKLKAGEASLRYAGLVEVDGIPAVEIVFTAKALNFFDEEKIYLDPATFYPVKVKRDLDLWGKKEQITEAYDHAAGTIKILKEAGGKITEQTLEREGPIDNIYAFIYRYRMAGTYSKGEVLNLHLPTKDVSIKLVDESTVTVASGEQLKAHFLQSDPKQYELWIGAGETRIPLRIDGAVGLGKTLMVMSSYEAGKVDQLN